MKHCSACLTAVALLLGMATAGANEPESYQDAVDPDVSELSQDMADNTPMDSSVDPAEIEMSESSDETAMADESKADQDRVRGDVLDVPPTSSTTKTHILQTPPRGMSMPQVEKKFGTPVKKLPAVGKPPISRWIYGDYTVYFEGQYVIHSVLNGT